ncbi:hypothetical protein J7L02_04280 [Candidatus Woesearchaeota archaeon]|nr:hypothetical protein [Candidatus Woesearchaeota archaeon]
MQLPLFLQEENPFLVYKGIIYEVSLKPETLTMNGLDVKIKYGSEVYGCRIYSVIDLEFEKLKNQNLLDNDEFAKDSYNQRFRRVVQILCDGYKAGLLRNCPDMDGDPVLEFINALKQEFLNKDYLIFNGKIFSLEKSPVQRSRSLNLELIIDNVKTRLYAKFYKNVRELQVNVGLKSVISGITKGFQSLIDKLQNNGVMLYDGFGVREENGSFQLLKKFNEFGVKISNTVYVYPAGFIVLPVMFRRDNEILSPSTASVKIYTTRWENYNHPAYSYGFCFGDENYVYNFVKKKARRLATEKNVSQKSLEYIILLMETEKTLTENLQQAHGYFTVEATAKMRIPAMVARMRGLRVY